MLTQYHLSGPGFSGRAVRIRELKSSEVENNLTASAKLVGEEGTNLELAKTTWRNGVKLMLAQISEPCLDPMAPETKWKKVSPVDLDDLDEYFKPKDMQALEAFYRQNYELDAAALDAISKKALPVSEA